MSDTPVETRKTRDEAAKDFALELVALARKHGANRMTLNFDMTGHTADWQHRDRWNHGDITLQWSNGRHGARDTISLKYQSSVSLLEADPTDKG
jgi:hypothetical protein